MSQPIDSLLINNPAIHATSWRWVNIINYNFTYLMFAPQKAASVKKLFCRFKVNFRAAVADKASTSSPFY